jgi:hypothetical protein
LGRAIRVDDDELREGEDFDAFFLIEHDPEEVLVGTSKGFVFAVNVVTHEEIAKMATHFFELELHDVFFFDFVEISVGLLVDRTYFL